ncbi:MAG: dephospho-CoA kinase [Psychrobium sp.]|nr:dephospho-CoA kinase [Psychrobium sp.]
MTKKFIIGLTGGIASGKTTVANLFGALGVDIVDADIVAREVVAKGSPALAQISQHFGPDVLDEHGLLNRARLREIIFSDVTAKQWLNDLMHPLIRQSMIEQLAQCTSDYCLLVAPLLIENNMQSLVQRILVVDVTNDTQISRTIARDGSDLKQVKMIIAAQVDRKTRLSVADDVINNDEKLDRLTSDVKKLHYRYLEMLRMDTEAT